jgi:hypothetical protein
MLYTDIDYLAMTYGADKWQLVLDRININHPTLQFTKANCKLLKSMPYGDTAKPLLGYLQIQKGEATYEFLYGRHNISDVASGKPVLTTADKTALKAMNTSEAMLDYIAKKWNVAFTSDDFWVSPNSKDYTGGTTQPNWLMKSQYSALGWWGEMIVHLH